MGWPTNSIYIEGDEEDQVTFLLGLLNATKELNMELFIHPFLHGVHFGIDIFDTIGLKQNNGEEKLIYDYWMSLKNLEQN